jgi:hypothetical protein
VAVQVRDLARRWSEIRENTAISQLQDAILRGLGIAPEDVPGLAADQAVFALAPSGSSPSLVPFVLLRPDDRLRALEVLAGFDQLALCESRDALWVGPASAAPLLDRFARGAERRLADILPIDEIDVQLPGGGLARGYVNPGACAAFLAQLSDRADLELPRWIAGWLQAEFSVLRDIAFRRDVIGGAILTDAVAAFDLAQLPAEISRELASSGKPARAAPMLPPGIIASLAFHPHAPAWMPWLRYLSGLDGHGPFRNLAFWMSEFERRYRRDLERDVCAAIGEHGWFLLLEGDQIGTADAVMLIETKPCRALEPALDDLLAWAGESAWVEGLGLLFPRHWRRVESGMDIHGLDLWTPLGQRNCLTFAVAGSCLILASGESALRAGQEIAEALPRAQLPGPDPGSLASLRVSGAGLARLIGPWLDFAPGLDVRWSDAAARLLAEIEGIEVNARHEPGAVRVDSRVRFGAER